MSEEAERFFGPQNMMGWERIGQKRQLTLEQKLCLECAHSRGSLQDSQSTFHPRKRRRHSEDRMGKKEPCSLVRLASWTAVADRGDLSREATNRDR